MYCQKHIDLFEKRVEALEEQILSKEKENDTTKKRSVTDLLLQTQCMISSALSCREVISSILKHLNTINAFLDPTQVDNELVMESKRQYLLELYPQLISDLQLLDTLEKITPITDSTNLLKVTDLSDKLDRLVVHNMAVYEEGRKVTASVLNLLQQYSDISNSIKMLFAQLDVAVTDLETAMKPKLTVEE